MVRFDIKKISLALNVENIFDFRQTEKENIIIPPFINPSFRQIWGPVEGRAFNLSAKISW
jgi:outer membrane receptor for ferrienterochelin and colicins